ncbi:hypothetical protein [Acinetobacter sp.]|uniref:hypothetical protein n=1 Tax=Acinetobacter sp. TaxID=472 RepID=UPI003890312C
MNEPLRHPIFTRLFRLKIFDKRHHELNNRGQALWDEVVELCEEIRKHGWTAERMAHCLKILKNQK